MAKAKTEDQNAKDGGQPEVNGHPDNRVQRAVPDDVSAATEENIAKVAGDEPTDAQAQEIDRLVASTGLPRAIIQEQVLVKHPVVKDKVVNAEDDDASRATVEPTDDLLPEPKRVVKGTPGTPGDLVG